MKAQKLLNVLGKFDSYESSPMQEDRAKNMTAATLLGPYRVNPDSEAWLIKLDRANFRKLRADATINDAVVAIHAPSATQAIKCDSTWRGG